MPSPPLDHAAIVVPSALVTAVWVTAPGVPAGLGGWGATGDRDRDRGGAVGSASVPELSAIAGTPAHRRLVDTRGADVLISHRDRGRITQAQRPAPGC